MLGSCCACAKEAPAHSAVTRTARRALPVELGMDGTTTETQRRTNDRRAIARERHGLFRCGAFVAARVRRPSIQRIRERCSDHVPPARTPGRLILIRRSHEQGCRSGLPRLASARWPLALANLALRAKSVNGASTQPPATNLS